MADLALRLAACALVAALIVPAGAQLIGLILSYLGDVVIRHSESLRAAYHAYISQWRSY